MSSAIQNRPIPALRFRDFNDEGKDRKLTDLCHRIGDGIHSTPIYSDSGDIHFINGNNLNEGTIQIQPTTKRVDLEEAKKHQRPLSNDTILLSINGTIGNIAFYRQEQVILGKSTCYINVNDSAASKHYIYSFLGTERVRYYFESELTGSTIKNLSLAAIRNLHLYLPTLPEQIKIADFLTAVDRRIEQLIQKKALLEDYKKGVMQQLFTQAIRFKDDDGNDFPDWEEKKLGEVFERLKRKNEENNTRILTISAQDGLVDQKDYFDRSIASKDASGYYLLHENDFAYNKSYSKGYPMGAIKRLTKYETGSVSPLYICFCANESGSPEFFSHYFDAGLLNHEIHRIAQEGVRNHGLLNVSVVEFFRDLTVQLPSIAEQTKIADFLSAIDRKIESVDTQITETQTFKKGLLQQMFV